MDRGLRSHMMRWRLGLLDCLVAFDHCTAEATHIQHQSRRIHSRRQTR